MSQAQRVVIALFACLVIWLAAQSRMSWQHPILSSSEQPHQQSATSATGGENQAQNLNWNNWTRDPVAVFTGLLTLFNGLLFVSTIGLWLATRKTASISERALIDLERAYIFVQQIGGDLDPFVTMDDGSGNPRFLVPDFSVTLVNYGRTAENIDLGTIRIEILEKIPPEIQPTMITASHPRAQSAEIIIGPNNTYTFDRLTFEHPFKYEHGLAVRKGTMSIYCHGFFSYLDIFGNSHPIKFCRRYALNHPREWVPEGGRERNSA
jgi:hypothetical protein